MAICLLLKENPALPLQFRFKDECLIERLKKERQELIRKLEPNSDLAKEASATTDMFASGGQKEKTLQVK